MSDIRPYTDRTITAAERANDIKSFAHVAQFSGGKIGLDNFIGDKTQRAASVIEAAKKSQLFSDVNPEFVKRVAPTWAESLREYSLRHKDLPADEILANAYQVTEHLIFECGAKDAGKNPVNAINSDPNDRLIFESVRIPDGADSVGVSTGILRQALYAAMIMPLTLGAATADMATFVPCARDSSMLYMIRTIAASTFGDIEEGDQITPHTAGAFSQMKRRSKVIEAPDGIRKSFTYKIPDAKSRDIPVRAGYSKLIVNAFPTESYDTNGKVTWYAEEEGNTTQATLTIDIKKGEFAIEFSTAPEEDTDILVEYQINIEKRGDLIPVINQVMLERLIKPNQYAIASEHTLQALFDGRREFNIDIAGGLLSAQRNVAAHEIDMTRLRVAIDFTRHFEKFDVAVPLTLAWDNYIKLLKGKISHESTKMANRTMVRGIRGLFAGENAAEIIKQMPALEFVPSDYSDSPHIQYIGRLFGRYNVYQVPKEVTDQFVAEGKRFDENSLLCYGRGENIGEAGIVTGDAVPLLPIPHAMTPDLVSRNTMWGSMINDVNPFNGWEYFTIIELTSEKTDSYNILGGTVNEKPTTEGAGRMGFSLPDDFTESVTGAVSDAVKAGFAAGFANSVSTGEEPKVDAAKAEIASTENGAEASGKVAVEAGAEEQEKVAAKSKTTK